MLNTCKRCGWLIAVLALLVSTGWAESQCNAVYGDGAVQVRLATGSPGELGLVEVLANAFNKVNGSSICWKKAGSGKSLKLLKDKEVDLVMVHAPAAEKAAVDQGWAIKRSLIGSNEFYIVGPAADPAGIAGAKSAADAYAEIAAAKAPFLSRGDNSGTHKKEMFIWSRAGIEPSGAWYIITQTFMLATLKQANDVKGYFMTDSSTWVAAKKEMTNLKVLFRGDPVLINTYHALCQPEGATPHQAEAAKFVDFVASEAGQSIIRSYGVAEFGESLYNDAEYAKQYDH
jgi:tungstate transport system substrate-binding protein